MNRFFSHRQVLQGIRTQGMERFNPARLARWLLVSLLCVLVWIGPLPAYADVRVDARLREQVLQIIRENPEVILESVQAYHQREQAQIQQARQSFLAELDRNAAGIIGQSPTTGPSDYKVVLLEFSDFQCPYCAQAHDVLQTFVNQHRNQVVMVYKHYPLVNLHNEAMPAAKAAWAAQQQGKFWEYHDALFSHQDQLNEAFYLSTAQRLGLNMEQFNGDRHSSSAEAAIQADIQMANQLGIEGTPFFIFNHKVFSGSVQVKDLEEILAQG